MKVTKNPNRFFPDRAFSVEDVNRNLSHVSNMIRNDQDARYVYSSIRIPCGIYSSQQQCGPADVEDTARAIPPNSGPKVTTKGNHEAIRTFSFVPPFDMKLVSTDFYVQGGTEVADQIAFQRPMVAKVQWIVDDGGVGYPPSPKSFLPEGMVPSGDLDITRVHDQITVEIEDLNGFYARTDNGEYTLRARQCYRIMVSDPDIPSVTGAYDQTWFWRYKLAWIQLNFKYDKWQFEPVNRPDVTFKTANDKVELTNAQGTGVADQLAKMEADSTATQDKKKYPKPELHYFGIGNFNGYYARPSSANTSPPGAPNNGASKATQQTDSGVSGVEYDSSLKKITPDLDFRYTDDAGNIYNDTAYAHNFQFQAAWRSPMGASIEDVVKGKEIWAYSVGMAHGVSRDFWAGSNTQALKRHAGFLYHATLGHGLYFDKSPAARPRNYSNWSNNVTEADAPFWRNPNLRRANTVDDGALFVGPNPEDKLYRNDTIRGSTAIPEPDSSNDPRGGQASGFPGDYLAEMHSGAQYGTNPDLSPDVTAATGDLGTGHGTFDAPNVTIASAAAAVPGQSNGQDFQDDLFTIFHTLADGNTAIGSESQRRNFQKVYVLLWVV